MSRKSINLVKEEDIERWKNIKMQVIEEKDDPDLQDIELLRILMNHYESYLSS